MQVGQEDFILHQQLHQDTYPILDLDLCRLLLMNNGLFPWVILVPKKNNLREIIDLSSDEQVLLVQEIAKVSKAIRYIFSPDKLNIAALGNIVEQLHVHIIARYKNDKVWPKPVFGLESKPYGEKEAKETIIKFREFFNDRK